MVVQKYFTHITFSLTLALLAALSPLFQLRANAASLELNIPSSGFEVIAPGATRGAPAVKYNGSWLPTSAPYVWSTSDASIVSMNASNRSYTAHTTGDAVLTVSYDGQSTSFTVKVRRSTYFAENPKSEGIAPVLLYPGLNTRVSVKGLTTADDGEPVVGATVTFYEGSNRNGNVICTVLTNELGDASCDAFSLSSYYTSLYVYFAGTDQLGQASRATVD